MKRTASDVEAEEKTEFKRQFGKYADDASKIWNLDIFKGGLLAKQLNRFYQWNQSFSELAIYEFLRFLILKTKVQDLEDKVLAPSPIIERVWQCSLFRPRKYLEVCQILVQDIFEYNVDDARDPSRYEKTLELYKEFYGKDPDESCWPRTSTEAEESQVMKGEENLEDVKKTMYELIRSSAARLTPYDLKLRWGHIADMQTLRTLYVNVISSLSMENEEESSSEEETEDEYEEDEYSQDEKMLETDKENNGKQNATSNHGRGEGEDKNYLDLSYNNFGEGNLYYIRTGSIGTSIIVRCPQDATILRMKQQLNLILPNRKLAELILHLGEDEFLDDRKTLLDYGIFKDSSIHLSFSDSRKWKNRKN